MARMPAWTIGAEPVRDAGVDEVVREYFTELGRRVLGRAVTAAELDAVLAGDDPHPGFGPPAGVFLVARGERGECMGCAGVRLLTGAAPTTAELKRLYVRPAGRGTGLGRCLLLAAEETAKRFGAVRLVCETNTQLTEARTLHARRGYRETVPYEGHGRADHWFAKDLRAGQRDRHR
jgi:GNAT superfamily N-acetyltransferase